MPSTLLFSLSNTSGTIIKLIFSIYASIILLIYLFPLLDCPCDRNENFYGPDTIRVSTINRNGRNDIDVPIYVQPINDPPVINTPPFVVLDDMSDGVLIFGEHRDKFDFIVDPDLSSFPGI